MIPQRKPTDRQIDCLRWLNERGGNGYVDQYGRVVAAGEVRSQGSFPSWMKLVSAGDVAGENDRIYITGHGIETLEKSR